MRRSRGHRGKDAPSALRRFRGTSGSVEDLPRGFFRHHLHFPVVKLIEVSEALYSLATDPNPFALVTAAHRHTRQTWHDAAARYQAKRNLDRLVYRHGRERKRILDLFAVLDRMMRPPDALEQRLWKDIETIEGALTRPAGPSAGRKI